MYDVGDTVQVSTELRDPDGALVDATVTLQVVRPDGTVAPTSLVGHPEVGLYEATVAVDAPGAWTATWTATGAVAAVDVQRFPVGPGWISLAELKEELGLRVDDQVDDARLAWSLAAAVDYVARNRPELFAVSGVAVPSDVRLGTLRYAARLHALRRSPDGLASMGELGAVRIPGRDPEIERLLAIPPAIA